MAVVGVAAAAGFGVISVRVGVAAGVGFRVAAGVGFVAGVTAGAGVGVTAICTLAGRSDSSEGGKTGPRRQWEEFEEEAQ